MLSTNQIAEIFNQLFLQNKSMKQPHILHVDTNSQKLKLKEDFLVGHGQEWGGQSGFWTLKLVVSQE